MLLLGFADNKTATVLELIKGMGGNFMQSVIDIF
uniref:Uncharacterized protein n=1 Tax=Physcomitrium patens TaxID=3218 RepID=A0A2K1JG39_PHYPA|nr:hypothetical protein PHYPA_017906 [Physcomitrium patens]